MVISPLKSMSMKYIRFSLLSVLCLFNSCITDEDGIKSYLCSTDVHILNFKKTTHQCKYSITLNNTDNRSLKGQFQLTFKDSKKKYVLSSKEYSINSGNQQIMLSIDQCNFTDDLVDVCFAVLK